MNKALHYVRNGFLAGNPEKIESSSITDNQLFGGRDQWWAGRDSNPRRLTPPGLQPGPFDRSGTYPNNFSVK